MAKFLKRLAARSARAKLMEATKDGKAWLVTRHMIFEDAEGNELDVPEGEIMSVGADDEGNMALKGSAAVVVISDPNIAQEVADVLASSEELSDVNFVQKDAIDALDNGEDVDDVIDSLADAPEGSNDIEVAEVDVDEKESVESKFDRMAENRMNPGKFMHCESVQIEEKEKDSLNMSCIKFDKVMRESVYSYADFTKRVAELKGSIQPGDREVALSENGKVMGAFDKGLNEGILFLENEFDSVEDMDAMDLEGEPMMQDFDMGDDVDADVVESALGAFEESAKSGADYMKLCESLTAAKVADAKISEIAGTFDSKMLKECVRIWDHDLGKHVLAMKESVSADNFIAQAEEAGARKGRFSKRFFG